ncbi:DUF2147 domain-containing protein [Bradyrhizobium barranii subsp. apii]|uniref:DUF2147 domain-containing protein n=1 Tax=Bradyrhizobium barranii subsp. apii TaxID=2819348 RepID=A0A8T5VPN2_9BRAD|nr:DUF2147 domain-containing protein [Bradyrhizobium barranii]UPT89203.1 DUF2147 domain-containing protein [Bradyrhizobium barranii subsp. apii]
MRIDPVRTAIYAFPVVLAITVVLVHGVAAGRAKPRTNPFGAWLTQAGDAKVVVRPCGAAICGKVVWLKQPIDSVTGKPQTDDKNPDPSLRTHRIVGLQLFLDMLPSTPNSWSGRVYNADDGKSYASTVTLLDGARLEVRGCAGSLCGSEIWTRAAR